MTMSLSMIDHPPERVLFIGLGVGIVLRFVGKKFPGTIIDVVEIDPEPERPEREHAAYHEFIETKQRYRVVNIERLLECLDFNDVESFRKWYQETLNEKLACENHRREVYWSKAAVIGGEEWLPQAAVDSGLKHCKVKRFQTDTGEDVYYL